jgi:hypothetical protein
MPEPSLLDRNYELLYSAQSATQWIELALQFLVSLAPFLGGPWGAIIKALYPLVVWLVNNYLGKLLTLETLTTEHVTSYQQRLADIVSVLEK